MPFSTPEEVLDYQYNFLVANQTSLGLGFVGYAEEELLQSIQQFRFLLNH